MPRLLEDSTTKMTQSHSNLKIIFWDWCDEWMRGCLIGSAADLDGQLWSVVEMRGRAWGREITKFKLTDEALETGLNCLVSNLGGWDCPLSLYCFEQPDNILMITLFWPAEKFPEAVDFPRTIHFYPTDSRDYIAPLVTEWRSSWTCTSMQEPLVLWCGLQTRLSQCLGGLCPGTCFMPPSLST